MADIASGSRWPIARRADRREMHEGDFGPHVHEMSVDEKGALAEFIWNIDNVELRTVGIDIGSSTSHLMFAKVRLQRKTQTLSSQFVVVERKILWRSSILLTPFLPDNTIDAARLKAFIDDAYLGAGLSRSDVDSGAVILTGEAIKRSNAQAIALLFAAESGKFVCASAGHHLESVLAAHGSGAVALSRQASGVVLNVDIGGGTTKLALIDNGEIVATSAVAVGGRLIAYDEAARLTRIDRSASLAAQACGLSLQQGASIAASAIDRLCSVLCEVIVASIQRRAPQGLAKDLLLTSALPAQLAADRITFSGGVAEYIYGRERAVFGDVAKPLADKLVAAMRQGRIAAALHDPGQGIRATVIGASQFAVQVSGKTIHISDAATLPVHNVPVLFPPLKLQEHFTAETVAAIIAAALYRAQLDDEAPIALALSWRGDPDYPRLRSLALGIALALTPRSRAGGPLILIIDGDVGKTLGYILESELQVSRNVISIDGIRLREFDYVDVGEVIEPSNVVPVVIKSLLFPVGEAKARQSVIDSYIRKEHSHE